MKLLRQAYKDLGSMTVFKSPIGLVIEAAYKAIEDEALAFEEGLSPTFSAETVIREACAAQNLPADYFIRLLLEPPAADEYLPKRYSDFIYRALRSTMASGLGLLTFSPNLPGRETAAEYVRHTKLLRDIDILITKKALIEVIQIEIGAIENQTTDRRTDTRPSRSTQARRDDGDLLHRVNQFAPKVIMHCDWSKDEKKQFLTIAEAVGPKRFRMLPPKSIKGLRTDGIHHSKFSPFVLFLAIFIETRAVNPCDVACGFDFPIGVPLEWAKARGKHHFREILEELVSTGSDLGRINMELANVSIDHPFARPTGVGSQNRWLGRLGFNSIDEAKRECERRHNASCLFWLVGAQQVGEAALHGWMSVLAPLLHIGEIAELPPSIRSIGPAVLLPHDMRSPDDGQSLQKTSSVRVFETYPAIIWKELSDEQRAISCHPGGLAKRCPVCRKHIAPAIKRRLQSLDVDATSELMDAIDTGFPHGEDDAMDSVLGAIHMLQTLRREASDFFPIMLDEKRKIEGWILGA